MLSKITFAELLEKVDSAPPVGSKIRVTDRGNQVFVYTENGYVPEIVWKNCEDEMPPGAMKVITDVEGYYKITTGKCLHDLASFREVEQKTMSHLEWTEYTPEKWEDINNERG